jgi:hypothetical protein
MLYREIIAVCSQIHTKHINTLCDRVQRDLCVEACGTYISHCALSGWYFTRRGSEIVISDRLTTTSFATFQIHYQSVTRMFDATFPESLKIFTKWTSKK